MAHSFDTKYRFTGNSAPLTQAFTCGAGATLLVVGIVVAGTTARAGGAPTFNGVSLVRANKVGAALEVLCEMWYLLCPPTGAEYTISIPNTGTAQTLYVCASSYKAQTGYVSVPDGDIYGSGTAANPSLSLTPTVAGDVMTAVLGDGANNPPTDRTHTLMYETDDGSYSDNFQYALIADTSTTAVGWTVATGSYCMIVAAFKEIQGSSAISVSCGADTYMQNSANTTNYGTAATIMVLAYTYTQKSLLSFDFSALLPAGASVEYARLELSSTTASGRSITCYRLRRTDWVETEATWNIYKTSNNWSTAGAANTSTDYDTTDSVASTQGATTAPWQAWEVTNQVRYAWDNVGGVAEFLLVDGGASFPVRTTWESRDYTTDVSLCPRLFVVYSVPVTFIPQCIFL